MSKILAGSVLFLSLIGVSGACRPSREAGTRNASGPYANSKLAQVPTPSTQDQEAGDSSKEQPPLLLKLTISVDKDHWTIGSPTSQRSIGTATLRIENLSTRDADVTVHAEFHLRDRFSNRPGDKDYYSGAALPDQIKQESPTKFLVIHPTIKCERGGRLDIPIDLGALVWGREIGAEGPNQQFWEVVPPGKYNLFLLINVAKSKGLKRPESQQFYSNVLRVVVEK